MDTRILIAVVCGISQEITQTISVQGWWKGHATLIKGIVRKETETYGHKEEHSRKQNNLEQNTRVGTCLASLQKSREANMVRTA